jgi:hypothetical protein
MSKSKRNLPNPPAFARSGFRADTRDMSVEAIREATAYECEPQKGATLRDMFAMAALQGLLAADPGIDWEPDGLARTAWKQADAMLEEREKR